MNDQSKFLKSEFWILSWSGSVQRALRYRKGVADSDRSRFRKQIIEFCEKRILPEYCTTVSESRHTENIRSLCTHADMLSQASSTVERYNVGIAQKLLNLQLKYLWASGFVARPPHCPVDRIILSKTALPEKNKFNWTQIDTIERYDVAIAAIKEAAGGQHIADWELCNFNRR